MYPLARRYWFNFIW